MDAGEGGGAEGGVVLNHPSAAFGIYLNLGECRLELGETCDSNGVAKEGDVGAVGITHGSIILTIVGVGVEDRDAGLAEEAEALEIKRGGGEGAKDGNRKREEDER